MALHNRVEQYLNLFKNHKVISIIIVIGIITIGLGTFISSIKEIENILQTNKPEDVNTSTLSDESEKKEIKQETYTVLSQNQTGGITAGKIEHLNIISEKKVVRDNFSLYRENDKVAIVTNPIINEEAKLILFDEVVFNVRWRNGTDVNYYFSQPYEFRNYVIKIKREMKTLILQPPTIKGARAVIIETRKK